MTNWSYFSSHRLTSLSFLSYHLITIWLTETPAKVQELCQNRRHTRGRLVSFDFWPAKSCHCHSVNWPRSIPLPHTTQSVNAECQPKCHSSLPKSYPPKHDHRSCFFVKTTRLSFFHHSTRIQTLEKVQRFYRFKIATFLTIGCLFGSLVYAKGAQFLLKKQEQERKSNLN